MMTKSLFFLISFLSAVQNVFGVSLAEQLKQAGYVEFYDQNRNVAIFTSLYTYFDELVAFLQANPQWAKKLNSAKERFIRSKGRHFYSTDFFGFYDESERPGRHQVAFYYSVHFHEFINTHYVEFKQVPAINNFFECCFEVQKPYGTIAEKVATELGLETLFSSEYGHPPLLLKVVKYLPAYTALRPHYDGTAFTLFLDSTDNQSVLISPYKPLFTVQDFFSPVRMFEEHSLVVILGTMLTEYSIYPTPHIVIASNKPRYSTIVFAMRPHYTGQNSVFPVLPNFKT